MAVAVIGGALLAVLEDLVGFVDFLELHFAGGVARIFVGVPFHRELAESRLELGFVRVPLDFQGFVIAALGRHRSDPPELHAEGALKDAAIGLTKNDPHPRNQSRALFWMRVMIESPLMPTSCCSCRRRTWGNSPAASARCC